MPDRQDDLHPTDDVTPFADALQRLAPQPPHLSRDALLFAAGKAAATPRLKWAWPGATAMLAGISFVLAAFQMSPESPRVQYVDRVVYVDRPVPDSAAATVAANKADAPKKVKVDSSDQSTDVAKALQVRRDVLRWGVDMLPESKSAGKGPSQDVAAHELRHWLELPPGMFALPAMQPTTPTRSEDDE